MITRQRRHSRARRWWLPLAALAFLAYFGFHAYTGSLGLPARERMEAEAARLTSELEHLRQQRAALERQVVAFRPDSLDADMIDQKARTTLNLIRPDEIVIDPGAPQQSSR